MADNLPYTPGSGASVAADDIGGVHYQRVKLGIGADGSATDLSAAAPLPIGANTAVASATVSVGTSATALPTTVLTNRRELIVQNRDGTKSMYVGPSGVTTSSGLEVGPAQSLTLRLGAAVSLFGITTAGTLDARVFEVS